MLTPESIRKSRRLMDQTSDRPDPSPVLRKKHPWQMEKSLVEVVNSYDAKVVRDAGEFYDIEFYDSDNMFVEAKLEKKKFSILPHEVGEGTEFWITIYKLKDKDMEMSVWPVAKYWHESWK